MIFSGCVKQDNNVVKVGLIVQATGKAVSIGDDVRQGVYLGLDEVNKDKNIIQVIFEDDGYDQAKAVVAYRKLVDMDGVKTIIGAVYSSSTLAIAPLAEHDKVIIFNPGSGDPKITTAGDFIFRNHALATQKVEELGKYLIKDYNNISTIYDNSNETWVLCEKTLVKVFEDANKIVLSRNPFSLNDMDFKTIVDKIKDENVQLIFVGSHMPQSAEIIKELRAEDINARIVTEDITTVDSDFQKILGSLLEGNIFSGTDFDQNTAPEFWAKYTAKYSKNPSMYSAQGYDNIKILGNIISNTCKDGNSYCIKDELYKIKDYNGASGNITIDPNGDALKPIVIKEIINGKFVKLG